MPAAMVVIIISPIIAFIAKADHLNMSLTAKVTNAI